jgi:predicted RND superfamily exporter protein
MIGSVMLGLIVDNTIHLLHYYRRARRAQPPRAAVAHALAAAVVLPAFLCCRRLGASGPI